MDVLLQGRINNEEPMTEVIQSVINLKGVPNFILRVNDDQNDLQGRVAFSQGGYILGGRISGTNEADWPAVRKLLSVKSGNFAILDPGSQHVSDINQTLSIAAARVVSQLSNLPDTPESLLGGNQVGRGEPMAKQRLEVGYGANIDARKEQAKKAFKSLDDANKDLTKRAAKKLDEEHKDQVDGQAGNFEAISKDQSQSAPESSEAISKDQSQSAPESSAVMSKDEIQSLVESLDAIGKDQIQRPVENFDAKRKDQIKSAAKNLAAAQAGQIMEENIATTGDAINGKLKGQLAGGARQSTPSQSTYLKLTSRDAEHISGDVNKIRNKVKSYNFVTLILLKYWLWIVFVIVLILIVTHLADIKAMLRLQ